MSSKTPFWGSRNAIIIRLRSVHTARLRLLAFAKYFQGRRKEFCLGVQIKGALCIFHHDSSAKPRQSGEGGTQHTSELFLSHLRKCHSLFTGRSGPSFSPRPFSAPASGSSDLLTWPATPLNVSQCYMFEKSKQN